MIKVTSERNNGCQGPTMISERTVGRSLMSLCKFELGFGGRLIEVKPTKLVTLTHVMSCEDRTTFEGPEKEMKTLSLAALLFMNMSKTGESELMDRMIEFTGGRPLLITAFGGLSEVLHRVPISLAAAALAVGFVETDIKPLSKMDLDDSYAAMDVAFEYGVEKARELVLG